MRILLVTVLINLFAVVSGFAVTNTHNTSAGKWSVGTSAFIVFNLIPDQENPPNFFQFNCGYWVTGKDVVSLEAITWKYNMPLGIPYGPSFEDPKEKYPGYVRDFGLGISYQHHFWKGIYAGLHVLPMVEHYVDNNKNRIQNGFMLFSTIRTGYHVKLFNDRIFLEPSIACTYWPVKTNVPSGFSSQNAQWPNYFLFEPGLHGGVKF